MSRPESKREVRLRVFVTVGMGAWPFDRLLRAVATLAPHHDLFVQRGPSDVAPALPGAPFVSWQETQRHLREADVVVTHAGNTVRLVQRLGKIPIAVAREAARGEMRNDHQVEYLAMERTRGRVIAVDGDLSDLNTVVSDHPRIEATMLSGARALPVLDADALGDLLDEQLTRRFDRATSRGNPFSEGRAHFAFEDLRHRPGRHLEVDPADDHLARALRRHTRLEVAQAQFEPESGCVGAGRTQLRVAGAHSAWPSASTDSVSALTSTTPPGDMIGPGARAWNDRLAELRRVLVPGGRLVLVARVASPVERLARRTRVDKGRPTASALLESLASAGFEPRVRETSKRGHELYIAAVRL